LVNRSQFTELTEHTRARHRREGGRAAVMYLDLDCFKPVNDRHGHEAGDTVLRALSARLRESVRDHDVVARLGGDEFAVLLDGASPEEVRAIEDRIVDAVKAPFELAHGHMVEVGVSLGIAYAVGGDADVESLLRVADLLMYAVKEARHRTVAVAIPGPRAVADEAVNELDVR
jgi:diguanylate cyclase (GGDEF)-like protein